MERSGGRGAVACAQNRFRRSRRVSCRVWIAGAALFAFCAGPLLPVQDRALAAEDSASAPPSTPSSAFDPTRPETQPNLKQDSDPILAPGPQAKPKPAAPPASAASSAASSRQLKQQKNGIYTLSENVNEVLLSCAVVDDKGNLVTDLKQGDFKVWEDGVPQTINSFRRQDLPAALGILVDNSGSMREKRGAVQAAALDLMRASNPLDTAFIVNFSDRAYLDQNPTSKISLLQRGLSRFDAAGTTAIYDAVAASADELSATATQSRQVLLIITDGADNASRLTLQQVVRRVQLLGGPVVYAIGLLYGTGETEATRAKIALETLSADTGGIAYFPSSLDQVDEIARAIARDIREQYTVGYRPTRKESLGGYRSVRVEASAPGHRRLDVRTRHGYYPNAATPGQPATEQAARAIPGQAGDQSQPADPSQPRPPR